MTVKVPNWVLEETTEEEILINWSTTLALRKMHEYGRQVEIYERKYGLPFEAFEQRVLSSEQEHFEEWDDYVVWKGLHLAAEKWRQRYQELRSWKT
ncbi:MAG: hypothetical protein FJ014_12030 [Chloroflexi bacterium]|nr:hypothetical protein [Chloroflexota bacterium]